jgi:WD40 repeat protein
MGKQRQEEQWQHADEEVRKKLPPGVKLGRTLRGHKAWIGRIAWSPDGGILASPSGDMTIRLWDAKTGKCLHTLEGHERAVWSVAFHPDAPLLASANGDNTVKLWSRTKPDGPWDGWYAWPDHEGGKGRVAYYDIQW